MHCLLQFLSDSEVVNARLLTFQVNYQGFIDKMVETGLDYADRLVCVTLELVELVMCFGQVVGCYVLIGKFRGNIS